MNKKFWREALEKNISTAVILQELIIEALNTIIFAELPNLVESMPRQLQEVENANGAQLNPKIQ